MPAEVYAGLCAEAGCKEFPFPADMASGLQALVPVLARSGNLEIEGVLAK